MRLLAPTASASRWRSLTKMRYRPTARKKFIAKANQRYIAVKYSVRDRDLGSTVEEAIAKVNKTGEAAARDITSSGQANTRTSSAPMRGWPSIVPLTVLLIFLHPLHDVQVVQVGGADHGQCGAGAVAACWRSISRTRISASHPASESSPCSVFRCKRASSCWSTSTSCVSADTRCEDAAIEGAVCGCDPS